MVYGVWCMVYGVWCTVYSVQRIRSVTILSMFIAAGVCTPHGFLKVTEGNAFL